MVHPNGLITISAARTNMPFIGALSNKAGQIHRWATFTDWMGVKIWSTMRQWHTSFNHLKCSLFKVKHGLMKPRSKVPSGSKIGGSSEKKNLKIEIKWHT